MRYTPAGILALLCLCLCLSPAVTRGGDPGVRNSGFPLSDSVTDNNLSLNTLSDRALHVLNERYTLLNKLVQRQTEKMLQRMKKKELALQAQIQSKDSLKAKALFAQTQAMYQQLLAKLQSGTNVTATANPLKQYIPKIDSVQTALRFLAQVNTTGQPGISSLPAGQLQNIQVAGQRLQQLQGTLQSANEIQTFIRQREMQLQDQLMNSGVAKQLLGINKEAYYYQAQLSAYKDMLNSPDKMTAAVLNVVSQAPAFQKFFQQNSYFSQLFPTPSPSIVGTPQEMVGLQTRDQVQKEVRNRLGINANSAATQAAEKAGNSGGGGSGGGLAYLQQQMQKMQTDLNQIKNNLQQYGTGSTTGLGSSQMTVPNFTPNSQHTKTFLKRIQYSLTVQNTASTAVLPMISSVGLNIGYKISDKSTIGIGGSYLLGLGYGIEHIRLSNQGVGLRSFVDIKAKGSIWITGGFEYNYFQQFTNLQNIPHLDVWQRSALIGLTKKYQIGKKENNIQLLYDLLADSEVPRGQPFQFRMGFGF
jgi:hypothetical protein